MSNTEENINNENDIIYSLTEVQINSFIKTRQDFIDWKTTARNWEDIEKDLDKMYK